MYWVRCTQFRETEHICLFLRHSGRRQVEPRQAKILTFEFYMTTVGHSWCWLKAKLVSVFNENSQGKLFCGGQQGGSSKFSVASCDLRPRPNWVTRGNFKRRRMVGAVLSEYQLAELKHGNSWTPL